MILFVSFNNNLYIGQFIIAWNLLKIQKMIELSKLCPYHHIARYLLRCSSPRNHLLAGSYCTIIPITIVGDIHGQYYDFLKILEIGGSPATNKYLFLGDSVDRGTFSIEVMLLILAIKITFTENVLLLRGNHECQQMTSYFNFRSEYTCMDDECLSKYNQLLYLLLTRLPRQFIIIKPGSTNEAEISVFDNTNAIDFVQAILNKQKSQARKNIDLVNMEGQCPDDRLLEKGFKPDLTKNHVIHEQTFSKSKKIDKDNEKRPDL